MDVIKNILKDPPPPLVGDVNFEETTEHQDLVDQSADWLESEMGVLNLGQIDYKILMADGLLTDEVKNGLIAWWAERVEDLNLG